MNPQSTNDEVIIEDLPVDYSKGSTCEKDLKKEEEEISSFSVVFLKCFPLFFYSFLVFFRIGREKFENKNGRYNT